MTLIRMSLYDSLNRKWLCAVADGDRLRIDWFPQEVVNEMRIQCAKRTPDEPGIKSNPRDLGK